MPDLRDILKMAVSDGAIQYDEILRILAGKLSIPVAFEAFKLLKFIATLLTLILANLNRMLGESSNPDSGI